MRQQEISKLLEEYRKGIISSDDRQKLEQISIEDDFVFDALEGMNEARNGKGEVRDLDILRGRLEKRIVTQKQRKLAWWIPSVAAAMLLIVGAMWLFQDDSTSNGRAGVYAEAAEVKKEAKGKTLELDSPEKESATVAEDESVAETILTEEPGKLGIEEEMKEARIEEDTEWQDMASDESETMEEEISVYEPKATKASAPRKASPQSQYVTDGVAVNNSAMDGEGEAFEDMAVEASEDYFQGDLNTEYSPERAQKPAADMATGRAKMKKESPPPVQAIPFIEYNGMVTDNYGEPLIGASVVVSGTSIGAITDLDGKVQLRVVDVENPRVVISYTGFNSIEIPLTNDFSISMQEGDALSEVVVVSNGRKKKARSAAEPIDGWAAFNERVASETGKIPRYFENSTIVVEFNVGNNGSPRGFKIVKGKDLPETELIIELIKAESWSKGDGKVIF